MRLILASASPRRAELLRSAGYTFEVVAADVDESIRAGETPSTYVRRLAADKSMAALKGCATAHATTATPSATETATPNATPNAMPTATANAPPGAVLNRTIHPTPSATAVAQPFRPADMVILGADTTVVVGGAILGKPRDEEDARGMLRRLSATTHQVLTGVSLRQGAYEAGRVETTAVTFRALTDEDISWYLASGEWRDKAGGYAIQGLASRFIPSITGSYSNVVGLPLACVDQLLRSLLASRL